ncbi:MAG: T9SS type A sorting domain-containing protein [Taibaiella sp.]|nr:T9SS type A sorting domain-containing protein [Taibaiella sp.]
MKNFRLLVMLAASVLWASFASAQPTRADNNTVPGAPFAAGGDPVPAAAENYNPLVGNELLVYPNPVTAGTVRIVLDGNALDVVDVVVLDMLGAERLHYKYAPGSRVLFLDVHTLPEGTYSVRVSWAGERAYNLRVQKI